MWKGDHKYAPLHKKHLTSPANFLTKNIATDLDKKFPLTPKSQNLTNMLVVLHSAAGCVTDKVDVLW